MLKTVLYTALVVLGAHSAQCAAPPKMDNSYMAYGEITQPLKDLQGYELQAAFEESYDAETENSAFVVWMIGRNITFVKNFKTNQTFKYTDGVECEETTEKEWIQSEYPPSLLAYEADDGTVRFSLKQLFNIPEKYLVPNKQGVQAVFRNIPARMWLYEIPGRDMEKNGMRRKLNIYSYWTNGEWLTTANEKQVPLGFVVDKMQWSKKIQVDETVISVFGFVSSTYNRKLFEPFQGVICDNRTQTYKFPAVQNFKAIALHSEMVLPDYQEIRYIDTWFDPQNQLVRIDSSRLRDQEDPIVNRKTKRYESEIAVGQLGVVFRQSVFKDGFQCDVIPFPEYQNDMQNFLDLTQNLRKWEMGKMFGLNDTTYVYTGKTIKSHIPCHVFQGVRKDWPEESANVTSLWEWCFNFNMSKDNDIVVFSNDELGLINAQVTIVSSGQPQDYPVGFRMFHHFYDITVPDPAILDVTKFDISRCFSYKEKRLRQFYLDWEIKGSNILPENLTSDVYFLQKWKAKLYAVSGLPSYSLRITRVQSTIVDKKLYIKFVILDKHKGLPESIGPEELSGFDAEQNLRDNEGKLSISYVTKKGNAPTIFKAAKGSMSEQINPDFEGHTISPLTSTESTVSTKFTFSLKTDSETSKSSTGEYTSSESTTKSGKTTQTTTSQEPTGMPEKKKVVKKSGHPPGTVAAISLATLLGGLTLGSAGTFYKVFGLPSFMR